MEVVQPLATKRDALAAGLMSKVDALGPRGGAALFDAIRTSLAQTRASFQGYVREVIESAHRRGVTPLRSTVELNAPLKRIIIVTGGAHSCSKASEADVVEELRRDQKIPSLAIFLIGVGGAAEPGEALGRIQSACGSPVVRILAAANVGGIAPAFSEVKRRL